MLNIFSVHMKKSDKMSSKCVDSLTAVWLDYSQSISIIFGWRISCSKMNYNKVKKEKHEVNANLNAAKEVSVDAAV